MSNENKIYLSPVEMIANACGYIIRYKDNRKWFWLENHNSVRGNETFYSMDFLTPKFILKEMIRLIEVEELKGIRQKPLTIKIGGLIPSKKNCQAIYRKKRTGKPFISPSAEYQDWSKWAIRTVRNKAKARNIETSRIILDFTFPTRAKQNTVNKAESILDTLVDANIIKHDNHFVCPLIILRGQYKKGVSETKITIEKRV